MKFQRIGIGIWLVLMACVLPLVAAQDTPTDGTALGFSVTYAGRAYDSATNQTTFTYSVTGSSSAPHDLSHFDIEIPSCTPPLLIAATNPSQAVSFGVDPTTGVDGIKWDVPLSKTESRAYSITFIGDVTEGAVQVAVKAGNGFQIITLAGASCEVASIDVDKFVSTDGVTWEDADDAPGPEYQVGAQVSFRFIISNIGNVTLSDIGLTDNVYDTSACALPATLAAEAFVECTIGPFPAVDGQHTNIAMATGIFNGTVVSSTDAANYFSGHLPAVTLDKTISKDGGGNWADSLRVAGGNDVWFKLVVTNTGNVALGNLVLTDDTYSTSSCTLPALLDAGASYECLIGPFPAGETDHTNTASITGDFEGMVVTDTDTASYRATDDDDSGVVIIIEGPIEIIQGNIITIFGINVEIDPNDTVLNTIRIGDIIRIEGDMLENGTTIIVIAVVIIVIDVDIILTGPPSGPIFVPYGCKLTGRGNKNLRLKCSGRKNKSSKDS